MTNIGRNGTMCWVVSGAACENEARGLISNLPGNCYHCDIYIKVMRSLFILYFNKGSIFNFNSEQIPQGTSNGDIFNG
jgi:hypothetical protein